MGDFVISNDKTKYNFIFKFGFGDVFDKSDFFI